MGGIIKFELTNMFKSVSFIVCAAIMALLSCSSVLMQFWAQKILNDIEMGELLGINYSGRGFLMMAPNNGNYMLIIGIVVSIFICSGYSQKTYRNILARGFSRAQLYIAKMIAVTAASMVYIIMSMAVGFITAVLIWGPGSGWNLLAFLAIGVEILVCITIAITFASIAFICKNMGFSIVIAVMAPSLLNIGAGIIDLILEYKDIDLRVTKMVLTSMFSILVSTPDDKVVVAESFLCMAAYLISFIALGYFGMRKDEV